MRLPRSGQFATLITLVLAARLFVASNLARADTNEIRIGFIASLSSFAAPYGTAVLEGAQIAVDELKKSGAKVALIVEDDQSEPKQTATSYQKLRAANHIDGLITGSWWVNSLVKTAERDNLPFLSCETLYDRDFIQAPNYFSLAGDLRDWVRIFEPLIAKRGWHTGTMIKASSGFADTINEELGNIFSRPGRTYLAPIEYQDLDLKEAPTIAAKVRRLASDIIYIDAQPQSFGLMMKKLSEQKVTGITVLTNPIANDAWSQKLFKPEEFLGEIYFSMRNTFDPKFLKKFEDRYHRQPILNADLGYYAVYLMAAALADHRGAIPALHSGLSVAGHQFEFDEHNVFRGNQQEIFTFKNGRPEKAAL